MHATIADIRRGDRFTRLTGRGGTFIALFAAKPTPGYERETMRVITVADQGDVIGSDGTMQLGSLDDREVVTMKVSPDAPVEIHDRELPIHINEETKQFTDTPNPHLGGQTDREMEAARVRRRLPELVSTVTNLGSERDLLIKQGLAAGVSAVELADLSGLSRGRVYQIKDGKR